MGSSSSRKMFIPLLALFLGLAVFFTYFRETIAQVNNWILATCKEGRVTKDKSAAEKSTSTKMEQLKATPGTTSTKTTAVQRKPMDIERKWSGTPPTLRLDLPGMGQKSKGDAFLTKWALLGPFKIPNPKERVDEVCMTESIDIKFVPDEGALDGTQRPDGVKWQEVSSNDDKGKIDFNDVFPNLDYAVAYGVAFIDSPDDISDAKLLTGSDDYLKVWINGELVHKYNTQCRVGMPDTDTTQNVKLKKGLNTIVFKCVDITGGWDAYLRLADRAGNSLCVRSVKSKNASK